MKEREQFSCEMVMVMVINSASAGIPTPLHLMQLRLRRAPLALGRASMFGGAPTQFLSRRNAHFAGASTHTARARRESRWRIIW